MTQSELTINNSPWLDAPGVSAAFPVLCEDVNTDVAVIGGGIAGVMTAFFLLRDTDRSVTMLEGHKIAHGATGHNAGQIDVFFEKPLAEMVKEHGTELTRNAYQAMFDAWQKIEEIITLIEWQGYYTKYIGYNVYTTKEQIVQVIRQLELFSSLGLEINELFLNADLLKLEDFPDADASYINWISHEKGSEYIGSHTMQWLGFEATHYATLNSAALCHAIISYLLTHYPDRFSVYEHALVSDIEMQKHGAFLQCGTYTIHADEVVLATNAFTDHTINGQKDGIDMEQVRGYMSGYIMNDVYAPKTICYEPPSESYTEGYYYHTTRHYLDQEFNDGVLLTLGGPEGKTAEATEGFPEEHRKALDQYVDTYYDRPVRGRYYRWGDMGYTPDGMRKVGPHPQHLHLRYNLGCNGVGILSSVHGGRKIAEYLNGNVHEKSVFDI